MTTTVIDIGTACSFSNRFIDLTSDSTDPQHGSSTSLVSHSSYPAGATVHITWASSSCASGVDGSHLFVDVVTEHQTVIAPVFMGCNTGAGSATGTITLAANTLTVGLGLSDTLGHASLNGVGMSVSPCGPPCPYGTRPQSGAIAAQVVTETLLSNYLIPLNAEWLLPVMAPLIGFDLVTSAVCANPPPVIPALELGDLNDTVGQVLQILDAVAWPHLCECVPGTPAATPPPPFSPVQPTGWPVQPTFPCDNVDPCAALVAIQQTLLQLQATLGQELQLTTLLQRYSLPFAFVPGATHGPLSGQGSFKIPRLVGLRASVLTSDPNRPVTPDVPPYKWDLGWMSVTNGSELLQERRVNRDRFDWLPSAMAMCDLVGYSLTPGTSITIQELEAET